MTNWRALLHILAIVAFALEVIGVPARINLLALGLALWALATVPG